MKVYVFMIIFYSKFFIVRFHQSCVKGGEPLKPHLQDSTDHFLVGSLYFYARPNFDSIYPAAVYLEKDIVHLMETLKWK